MAVDENVIQADDAAAEEAGFAEQFGESPTQVVADEQEQDNQQAEDLQSADDSVNEADDAQSDEQGNTEAAGEQNASADVDGDDTQAKLLALLNELPENKATTEKEIRQLHGKFGEINRAIQELKSQGNSGTANVRITKDQFKRLNEDFPEIAEMLADDLSSLSLPSSGGGISAEALQPFINTEVDKVRDNLNQQMQTSLLTIQHRDFVDVVKSEGFGKWKLTLSAEEQQKIDNSWDALYLGQKISEFKTFREQTNNLQQKRNQKLVNAVLPKSSNSKNRGIMTEEEAFAAQFRT